MTKKLKNEEVIVPKKYPYDFTAFKNKGDREKILNTYSTCIEREIDKLMRKRGSDYYNKHDVGLIFENPHYSPLCGVRIYRRQNTSYPQEFKEDLPYYVNQVYGDKVYVWFMSEKQVPNLDKVQTFYCGHINTLLSVDLMIIRVLKGLIGTVAKYNSSRSIWNTL